MVADTDFDRVKQKPLDFGAIRLRIREEAEIADQAFRRFRSVQIVGAPSADELRSLKEDLASRLARVAGESNRWVARQYGINPEQESAFRRWCATHEPFNWFTEFMGIIKTGGFDIVVGNPPYVAKAKIDYRTAALDEPVLADIYGNFFLRTLRLKTHEGRCGLIVPMSLMFSEDFSVFRDAMAAGGTNWLSSYDNIPAALFSGVSQRCNIWLQSPWLGQPQQASCIVGARNIVIRF